MEKKNLFSKNCSKKINVIDIFCGAGGLSYGFYKNKNFNILCANDIEKDMINDAKTIVNILERYGLL